MKIGEIYHVNFPYEEDVTKTKLRPTLIIAFTNHNNDTVFYGLKLTTKNRGYDKYSYPIKEWMEAGLILPSVVRCDKIQSFVSSDIVCTEITNGLIGNLSDRDLNAVRQRFDCFLEDMRKYSRESASQPLNLTKNYGGRGR